MNTAAAPTARLGFYVSACGHENHYRSHVCKTCGAPNVRAQQPVDITPAIEAVEAATARLSAALGHQVVQLPTAAVVAEPYVVAETFRCMLGNVTGVFKKGLVLTDWGQIQRLKQEGHPIVPASQADSVACCPNCKHVFPLMASAVGRKSAG